MEHDIGTPTVSDVHVEVTDGDRCFLISTFVHTCLDTKGRDQLAETVEAVIVQTIKRFTS